jgi:hypothetical protein
MRIQIKRSFYHIDLGAVRVGWIGQVDDDVAVSICEAGLAIPMPGETETATGVGIETAVRRRGRPKKQNADR